MSAYDVPRSGGDAATVEPYDDWQDHLVAELERLDLLFQLYFTESESETGGDADGPDRGFGGMYVSEEEVARLLQSTPDEPGTTNAALREQVKDAEATIARRVARSREAGVSLRLADLAANFGLSRRELDVLLLAFAPEVDRKYGKIYSYILDDITRRRPTVGVALRLVNRTTDARLGAMSFLSASSPLRERGLVRLKEDPSELPTVERSVFVDRHVSEFVLGVDGVDETLASHARFETSDRDAEALRVEARTRERVQRVRECAGGEPTMYYFHGPPGSGRADAAEVVATALDVPRVCVDASGLAGVESDDLLGLLEREATLRNAALQFEDVDALVDEDQRDVGLQRLVQRLDGFDGHVFLTGAESWTPTATLPNHEFTAVQVQRPSFELREQLWAEYDDVLPDELDTTQLAAKFSLTRGQIEDALFAARAFTNGDGLTPAAVYRGCRSQSSARLQDFARKPDVTYEWDDIVLPDDKMRQLREVAAHVKHRGTVYSEWGFEEKFTLGNGLSVLFSGPSGTGKTMAAEIIANDAGLDLYKVDIAGVVSKYIGETEKNLGKIFDEAEHSNAILFFDEADALFGQRSEVSDAQDRYANVEVNYLLQRIEEHDGTVILTTNFEQNIDDAFMRRLDVSISFPRPGEESRRAMWESVFPDDTPVGDLDVEFLSTFDLTGGNVKNVAQTAAFLAADDEGVVEMDHVVLALKLELEKLGKLVNPTAFGDYQDMLTR